MPRTPLVGRGDELAGLLGLAASGDGGIALVTGDAGIGKSRLLDELAARVGAAGTPVLRGHAVAGGGAFRPLVEALVRAAPPALGREPGLVSFRGALARLLPTWVSSDAPAPMLVDPVVVLGEAVLALLAAIAGGRRLLVLLDDMHWADPDSLALLEYLAGGLAELPVLVVAAARDDEHAPEGLAALRRRAHAVLLGRLDDEHVATLARRCAGDAVSEDVLAFLVGTVDGLPLLVEELFAGLVETGRIHRDQRGWHAAGPLAARVPDAFAALVAHRVDGLPGAAATAVRTAAVLGSDVDWAVVAAATGSSDDAVATELRAAVDATVLVVGEDGALRWRHALTRDAVLAGLSSPERAALCRRAAETLAGTPLQGDRLALAADLYRRAGAPATAADLLLRLARETVAAGALAAAEEHLRSAATLAAESSDLAADIAVERVHVLALGARTDEAITLGDAVLPTVAGPVRRDLAVRLARACVAAERWDPAAAYLRLAGADTPATLALAAHVALGHDDRDGSLRLAASAVEAGERAGDHESVCEALEITGRALRRADPPASEAAFARGERLAAAHGLTPWRIRALAELGTHDILGTRGTARLEAARTLALGCGLLGTAAMLDLQIMAGVTSRDGQVAALPLAQRCVEHSDRLKLPGPATHARMFVVRALFWADRDAESHAVLDGVAGDAPYLLVAQDAQRGHLAWLGHDAVAGAAGLGAAVDRLRRSPVSNPAPVWGQWVLLATVADPGDPTPRDELRGSDLLVQSSNRAALHFADAVAAVCGGRPFDEVRTLLAAGDAETTGKRYERLLLRALMVSAISPGGPAEGLADPEAWLREALAFWEPAGEVRLARWCRERLRALGVAVPRPGRDRTAVPSRLRALGVTGREHDVLLLVAEGHPNADIAARLTLSTRTVESHVSSLLAKTSAPGRAALHRWV